MTDMLSWNWCWTSDKMSCVQDMKWVGSVKQERTFPLGRKGRMASSAADITSWRSTPRSNGDAADAFNLLYVGTPYLVACISKVEPT
jgi:hypothetical protein